MANDAHNNRARTIQASQQSTQSSDQHHTSGTMTRQEAGRKGGKAPHICRGRGCNSNK
jgi:hypothetical protein